MDKLFLAVDGGGTKAEFAIFKEDGVILSRFKIPGNNPNFGGMDKTKETYVNGIDLALKEYPNIKYVFCGNAGLSIGDNRVVLRTYLADRYPNLKIECDTDLMNLISLSPCDFALILGTGICLAVKDKDRFIRYGGLGHLLDKGGSAYKIGRDAIEIGLIKNNEFQVGESRNASLAPMVFKLYSEGNKVAEEILNRNAMEAANLIKEAMEHSGYQSEIFVSGGLAEHFSDIYFPIINKYVDIRFVTSKLPQILGAAKRCVYLYGKLTKEFENNFINSYKEN